MRRRETRGNGLMDRQTERDYFGGGQIEYRHAERACI